MLLSQTDKQAISRAITTAEKKTRGEIFCVIAKHSGSYAETALIWSGLVVGFAPLFFLLLMLLGPEDVTAFYERIAPWHSAQEHGASTQQFIINMLVSICALQILGALLSYSLCFNKALRQFLTPAFLKRRTCHQQALSQFMAQGLHVTAARTGVLIFVSIAERYVEIIADEGIFQRVKPAIWQTSVRELTTAIRNGQPKEGFIKTIESCGTILAEHFPRTGTDANELPDRIIEI